MGSRRNRFLVIALLVSMVGAGWLLAPEREQPAGAAPAARALADAGAARERQARGADSWSASPFGAAAPMVGADRLPAPVLARQEKMSRLAYATPERYYRMGLAQLHALAKEGDADAMLQLAEQYQENPASLAADPAYPQGADRDALARAYLTGALQAGRSRAAALLSKRFLDENNLIDAYAWSLMSDSVGGGSLLEPGADPFASLNPEQKALARDKFLAIADAASRAHRPGLAQAPGRAR